MKLFKLSLFNEAISLSLFKKKLAVFIEEGETLLPFLLVLQDITVLKCYWGLLQHGFVV